MADTQSVISDVKLFLDRLKKELPEIFSGKEETRQEGGAQSSASADGENRVLYNGDLFEARMYLTPDQEEGVAFDGSVFHIYLRGKDSDPSALVTQWLRDKAGETLRAKTKDWADKMGVEFNNIVIKDQRTLWASCSGKKNINYSYRIVKMPLAVQDYLMVHELSHLVHMNHGQQYWELVAQYCPDYNHHRKWLNDNKGSVFAELELKYTEPKTEEPASAQTNTPQEQASSTDFAAEKAEPPHETNVPARTNPPEADTAAAPVSQND